MNIDNFMPVLVATSVVRGSQQGESHGGVYLVDFDKEKVTQAVDWNRGDIDWQGRGWNRRSNEFDPTGLECWSNSFDQQIRALL
jgi:hypothetical protein